MNLNDSVAAQQETLGALIDEGAALFGANETTTKAEWNKCADNWCEALLVVAPMTDFLEPAGVWEEDGEIGFFYDPPTPGTANAARILRWMQGAHEKLKAQFSQ
jgi:hypothetical protein